MAINDEGASLTRFLTALIHEEELIIKPFHSDSAQSVGATECGKIVSRLNKVLFDYQIGGRTDTSMITSMFSQRIVLFFPGTKNVIFELYQNCLPLLCKVCCKQDVRCFIPSSSDQTHSIGFIRQGLALGKVWYGIYNPKREHVVSVVLRKSHLRSRIQHRVMDIEIFDRNESKSIGRIYPYSTHLERSEYRPATAMKVPMQMKVETKAILLIAALVLVEIAFELAHRPLIDL